MDPITIQLRSLATEYRNKADFFDRAADLQEEGYKSDTNRIAAAVAEKDAIIEGLQKKVDVLESPENATAEGEI